MNTCIICGYKCSNISIRSAAQFDGIDYDGCEIYGDYTIEKEVRSINYLTEQLKNPQVLANAVYYK